MDVIKFQESWATSYLQVTHQEALQTWGEQVILRLIWTSVDFEAGRVGRCVHCQGTGTDTALATRLSSVYEQAGDSQCTFCFGTGFEGGFEPTIYVSWMLAQSAPVDLTPGRSGEYLPVPSPAQFLWTPALDDGDLVVRVREWAADGVTPVIEEDRYETRAVTREHVRTGPGIGRDDRIVVGQTSTLAKLPRSSIRYQVPVS